MGNTASGSLMSKVISAKDVDRYLSGELYQISGFVYKADDLAGLRTYADHYKNLGLGYKGSEFAPVPDTGKTETFLGKICKNLGLGHKAPEPVPESGKEDMFLGVIRFFPETYENLEIPYGKGFGGRLEAPLPFTGNGFAGGEGSEFIIPEWLFTFPAMITDGAELYIINYNGDEILMAVYSSRENRFIRLEDMV